jgi:hypothetical protein
MIGPLQAVGFLAESRATKASQTWQMHVIQYGHMSCVLRGEGDGEEKAERGAADDDDCFL